MLVEMPLRVQFEAFAATFDLHMLHLVTQHVGLIGFKKGWYQRDAWKPKSDHAIKDANWKITLEIRRRSYLLFGKA